jgi:hypothetical protein
MMADQDRLPQWDDIQNLMSAIHAAFGLFGGIIRVLPVAFCPVLAALHLLYRYFVPSCKLAGHYYKNQTDMRQGYIYHIYYRHYHEQESAYFRF